MTPTRQCVLSSRVFLEHDGGPAHPESPDRLRVLLGALNARAAPVLERQRQAMAKLAARPDQDPLLADAVAAVQAVIGMGDPGWVEGGRAATVAELERAHDPAHIAQVLTIAAAPGPWPRDVGVEVPIGPGSLKAALWSAGTVIEAVDLARRGIEVWALVRPPGHHATRRLSQGFCVFNNVAVGALHALARPVVDGQPAGVPRTTRVAVLDWDVHHGDGTQDIFWNEPHATLVSIHQHPLYPESGAADERGAHDNIVNIPLGSGSDDRDYCNAIADRALPALTARNPDLLIVSAGFDAQVGDPLAGMLVTPAGFGRMAALVRSWAQARGTPLVFVLEGGYKVDTLADCVLAAMGVPE